MTLTFIGHGYVGLVTAAVFADLGNTVYVVGHTKEKIENLKLGILPIFEPELEEMVKRNIENKRLIFTLDYSPAIPSSDVVFIAVGTPPGKTGDAELSTVFEVAKNLAENLAKKYTVVVTKSTVPMGSNRRIKQIILENMQDGAEFDIASVPEFLREGSAIQDTLHPDRVVIGTENKKTEDILVNLHKVFEAPFVTTNLETAELVKYASNSFLATKISYANAIAKLAELCGADGLAVLTGIGLDKRIGQQFLAPGAGYGGSCFPKDVKALVAISKNYDYNFALLDEVEKINDFSRRDIVRKVKKLLEGDVRGKTIALLGLAFKSNTDDMRDASSTVIVELLKKDGAHIKAYDPQAMDNAKKLMPDISFEKNAYAAATGADVLIVVTDWNEFKELDLEKLKTVMKYPKIVDARNIYDPGKMKEMGFLYLGVGR